MTDEHINRTDEEVIDDKVNTVNINNSSPRFINVLLHIKEKYNIESDLVINAKYREYKDYADKNYTDISNDKRQEMALKHTEIYFEVQKVKNMPNPVSRKYFEDDYL